MKTAREVREERAEFVRKAQKLYEEADAEDREPTETEREKFSELMDRADKLEKYAEELDVLETALADEPDPEESRMQDPRDVRVGRDRTDDDPQRGFKSPRDFMTAVMQAGMGRSLDKRLRPLQAEQRTAGSDEQSTFADPYGGFLIPEGFSPDLLSLQPEGDQIASRVTRLPMDAPVVGIPARVDKDHSTTVTGGIQAYRRAEADTSSTSRMEFEQVKLAAHPLMAIGYATEELLTDSPVSFAALIEQGFEDALADKLMRERISGTGVGEFEGVLNADCTISITAETGQDADTIVVENIDKMVARCWGYSNAVWLANHDCYPQLVSLVREVGTGGIPVYHTNVAEGAPDTLNGRPIIYSEYAKTIGDQGDLILGNWAEYLEGVKQGNETASSIHVRFIYNERTFRMTARNDGRCWWRSALTPVESSDTLSPFVTLAART